MPRKVTAEGSAASVEAARVLCQQVMENGPGGLSAATQHGAISTIVECSKALIGRVIGRAGDTIAEIQRRTGARLQIDQVERGREMAERCGCGVFVVPVEWRVVQHEPRIDQVEMLMWRVFHGMEWFSMNHGSTR